MTDWKRGKYSIPSQHFEKLITFMPDPEALAYQTKEDWWFTSKAGEIGGKVSYQKHGLLGTKESRSRGGLNSYAARKNNPSDIFKKNDITVPQISEKLAEFIGILIGDGNMTAYQVSVALDAETDKGYVNFVTNLMFEFFGLQPTIRKVKNSRCNTITISSIQLVNHLHSLGILKGHKINQGLDIPFWIQEDLEFSKACLRGIFDTDGCIFQEIHRIGIKLYAYPRLSFVSASPTLLDTIFQVLSNLEFTPKLRHNRVNLEKRSDIDDYFHVVGSSNIKHWERYKQFGGVA